MNDGLEGGVGIYIDDVYYPRSGLAMFDIVDLERIEVLRGPQGTLFGKNSTGGAISIYTQAPKFAEEMSGEASVGDHGFYQLRGIVNVPLSGKVATRVTVGSTWRNGFVKNLWNGRRVNDFRNFSARGQLLLKPSEDLTIRLIADYADQNFDGNHQSTSQVITTRIDGTPLPNNFNVRAARFNYTLNTGDFFDRKVDLDGDAYGLMDHWGVSAKVDYEFEGHTLTSISAYRKWSWAPGNDADGTSLDIITRAGLESRQRQYTQEVRLASSGTRAVDYVVGAFYFNERLEGALETRYGDAAPLWLLADNSATSRAALVGWGTVGNTLIRVKSLAGFAQATWHVDDRLNLTGGLRYSSERKRGLFVQEVDGGADLSTLDPAAAAIAQATRNAFGINNSYTASAREKKLSGQITLSYQANPDVLVYATHSRGFKSGGINLANLAPTTPKTVDPEKVQNYEIGLKSTLFDRRVRFNIAAFWTIDDNFQSTIFDNERTLTYIANVGKVRSRGVEVDAVIRPMDHFSTYLSAAYTDAEYRSYTNAPCPIQYLRLQNSCDLTGAPLPGVSKWTLSGGGEYSQLIGSGDLSAFAGIDWSYRSSYYSDGNDASYSRIRGYHLVNARLGVRTDGKGVDFWLWSRNLFDKKYQTGRFVPSAFNTGQIVGFVGDPRTFGATARLHF